MTHYDITYGDPYGSIGHGTLIARAGMTRAGLDRKCRREMGEPLVSIMRVSDHPGCRCVRSITPRDIRLALGQRE